MIEILFYLLLAINVITFVFYGVDKPKAKKRHASVIVKIVPYHKSPLLVQTHDTSTEAMKQIRKEYAKHED